MNHTKKYFPALLVAFGVMTLAACEQEQAAVEVPLRPVKSMSVLSANTERIRNFSGTSKSSEEARLSFKVAGSVISRSFNVGDVIKPGDVIAELDPTPYELEVQQARANLASAEASKRNAEANYQRLRNLYENNNASRNDLDSARANAESFQAQVKADQKALEIAELNVEYTKLIANNNCSIASVSIEVNEYVNTGQEIVRANCGSTLEVEIAVPESLIQGIVQNTPAEITFTSIPRKVFTGKITEIGVDATGGGTTFPVTVRIDDEDSELRSGLAANIRIKSQTILNPKQNLIIIPANTVIEDGQGRYVYLLENADEDGVGIVHRQAVETGELTSAGLEIKDGLTDGDQLITAGLTVINDGQKVKK